MFLISLWMLTLGIQTGCTQQNELGTLSVVTGFFLESSPQGYSILADCLEFSGQAQNSNPQAKIIRTTATNLNELFKKLETQSQTPLYYSRAKVLLMKNPEIEELKVLFDMRILPADIFVLETDLPKEKFLQAENSFAVEIDAQVKKTADSQTFKLYQLIKNPSKSIEIPNVFVSDNGFYLRPPEHSEQKEGDL